MGPLRRIDRNVGSTTTIHECSDAVDIVDLSRDKNVVFVGQGDETAIEHPVSRTGQGDSVRDRVWPIVLNRFDVRRVNLSAPAAIDEL
jgi:hypothetical protein